MFEIFKKSETVHFYTNDPLVYEFFKIQKGTFFYPEWLKKIKNNDENLRTIKKCPGMLDMYKNSFIMPLWTAIKVDIKNSSVHIDASDGSTKIDCHVPTQRGLYMDSEDYLHLKIITPWRAYSKSNTKFLCAPCSFSNEKLVTDFFIPNAIRSYSISAGNNIHGFIINQDQKFELDAGSPIMHIFPITDKQVNIECHFDPERFFYLEALQPNRFSFTGSYFKKRKLLNKLKY